MKRSLLNTASALSLILLLAACALWVRSSHFGHSDKLQRTWANAEFWVMSAGGRLYACRTASPDAWQDPEPWSYAHQEAVDSFTPSLPMQAEALGFGLRHSHEKTGGTPYVETWIIIPFWALPLATAILPSLWLTRRWRRHRRRKGGMCLACGYDLRHTPDCCPECGARPTAAPPERPASPRSLPPCR